MAHPRIIYRVYQFNEISLLEAGDSGSTPHTEHRLTESSCQALFIYFSFYLTFFSHIYMQGETVVLHKDNKNGDSWADDADYFL